jgi:hypothetical protein
MAGQDGKPSISMEGVGRDAGDILHQEDGMVNAPRDSVQGSGEQVWVSGGFHFTIIQCHMA